MDQNYFIKEGYVARSEAQTIEDQAGEYWTDERIFWSGIYQYHVYELAYKLVRNKTSRIKVLDIGSGVGLKSKLFFDAPEFIVTLMDQPTVKAKATEIFPNAKFIPINLDADFEIEEKFDLIIFSDVIEHLLYPEKAVNSIKSLMHADSLLLISTPERDILRGKSVMKSEKPEHVREWNMNEFKKFMNAMGLKHIKSWYLSQYKLSKVKYFLGKIVCPFLKLKYFHSNQTHLFKL